MSTTVSRNWIEIQPHHFLRGPSLSGFKHSLNATQPLYVRAVLPNDTNCESGLKEVAEALSEHKDRLLTLHVRAVTPSLVGPFIQGALLSGTRRVPVLEELDISVHEDMIYNEHAVTLPSSVLHDIADAFPALRTLTLPGFDEFIPIPSTSTLLNNLTSLRINGAGIGVGSPLYSIFCLLHRTPNLKSLFYKTTDQFSYQISCCPPERRWSPTQKVQPVMLPIPLPHLRIADVSASGSGTDLLRCVTAPELRDVHFDASRIYRGLEDWTEDLIKDIPEAVEELSRRSPKIQRLAFTEIPQHDRVFKWIMTGEAPEGDALLGNTKGEVPFRGLEELIIKDAELSKVSIEQLSEGSPDPASLMRTIGLTDTMLARYVSQPGHVVLKKLGIYRTNNLSGEMIVAAAKKATKVLADNAVSGPLTVEFMKNHGPAESCIKELEALGVKVEWAEDVGGPDTERDGWWTPDFTVEDAAI